MSSDVKRQPWPNSSKTLLGRSSGLTTPGRWHENWPCHLAPCQAMQLWMRIGWLPTGRWSSQREKSLEPMYKGLANRYNDAGVEKTNYYWVDRWEISASPSNITHNIYDISDSQKVIVSQWKCSHQQKIWMKRKLESMGLWPGSTLVINPMKTVSLWRLLPQPELIDTVSDLPSPSISSFIPFSFGSLKMTPWWLDWELAILCHALRSVDSHGSRLQELVDHMWNRQCSIRPASDPSSSVWCPYWGASLSLWAKWQENMYNSFPGEANPEL